MQRSPHTRPRMHALARNTPQVMNLFSLGLGICVALFYCWQLALISIATVPLNAIGAMFQLAMVSGTSGTGSDTSKAGQVTATRLRMQVITGS